MNARRYEDWPERLDAFFASRRHAEFAYGVHDCCLFAADAVEAITGIDPASEFRSTYHSRFGSLRRLRQTCGRASLAIAVAAIFSRLNFPVITPNCAGRGDVVLLTLPSGETLCVISLAGEAVAASASGFIVLPRALVRAAWKI